MSAFFNSWVDRELCGNVFDFPRVSSIHIHHIGVLIIFIKMKDIEAFYFKKLHGFMSPIAQFHQMRTVKSPLHCRLSV